jgi:biopolymer transport protein ExbD
VVALKSADIIYVQRKQIPRESFLNEMTEIFARMPEKSVLIKADRALTYGDVRKVMLEANEAGFSEVSLVAETPQESVGK